MNTRSGGRKRMNQKSSKKCLKYFIWSGILLYVCWFLFVVHTLERLEGKESLPLSTEAKGKPLQVESSRFAPDPEDKKVPSTNQHLGPRLKLKGFHFDRQKAEDAANASSTRYKLMTAYIENGLDHEIAGTRFRGSGGKFEGIPPRYLEPQPLRLTKPTDLKKFEYPKVNSCYELPTKLPVDAGLLLNDDGSRVYPNVRNQRYDFDVLEEAKFCPVDADPFLPWIHDVFPSIDGTKISFIAQNKRRCNTGNRFQETVRRLEPQVTLMQPVGIKRIGGDEEAQALAPSLWLPSEIENFPSGLPRYRLASYDDSDQDSKFTRYICRFHTREYDENSKQVVDVIIGETLSQFPFNYEFVNLRKRKGSMLTVQGKDNGIFWLSSNRFECPVPENGNLQEAIASGDSVLPDGTASIYVDLVPIRTAPRFGYENGYFSEDMTGPDWFKNISKRRPAFPMLTNRTDFGFLADKVFGKQHILPRFEASGRWANIPICQSYQPNEADIVPKPIIDTVGNNSRLSTLKSENLEGEKESDVKKYTLTACVWASSSFHTRGGDRNINDTKERIREWIEFHLMVGFDHIYIYDNTHANVKDQDLIDTLSIFSKDEVTRIEWPYIVCNNNLPAHENTGERSSQYAAEASCRERYGKYTEWMASFDPDEYFIPQGEFSSMKDVVKKAGENGYNILSFRSTRAYPDFKFTYDFGNDGECGKIDDPKCRAKKENATFLETYNCEFDPLPKPEWSDRAKKQIYRPNYVLSHFVHYSTVTRGILETYLDRVNKSKNEQKRITWDYWYREPIRSERFTDELNEAVMIHAKTTVPGNTKGFPRLCRYIEQRKWNEKCRLGFEIPNNILIENATTPEGFLQNCYKNRKVTEYYVPLLKEKLKERLESAVG